jgi:cytoskeletal protein CcmA (bactofilin family)
MSFWNRFDNPPAENPPTSGRDPAPTAAPTVPSVAAPTAPAATAPAVQAPAVPAAAPASTPLPSPDLRLGRGVRLEGKLTFSGTVRVDATFQGEIVTDGVLVVGDGAKVDAKISCGTIVIEGEVNGNITASAAVELRPTGRVRGDVETPSLAVDRGAFFEGSSKRPRAAGSSSDRRNGKAAAAPASSTH